MRPPYGVLLSSLALCSLAQAGEPEAGVPAAGATSREAVATTDAGNAGPRDKSAAGPKTRVRYTFAPATKK